MKAFLVICSILIAVATVKSDILNEDTEAMILNEKVFKELYECIIGSGPCTEKTQPYRNTIPGYIRTLCSGCSKREKELFEKYDNIVYQRYPKWRKNLEDKYGKRAS